MTPTDSATRDRDVISNSTRATLERFLAHLGFDPTIVDGIIGDLTEERVRRRDTSGALLATGWYVREIARSLPAWVVGAFRRGDPYVRLRIAGSLALMLAITTSGIVAYLSRSGPPTSIVLGGSDPVAGVVVNHTEPTMLETTVLDDRGHRLPNAQVEFRPASGAPIAVSSKGLIHCTANADATIRATSRGVSADFAVHCRPVRELRVSDWVDLVVGDAPRDLPFVAIGVDGDAVTQLRGATVINDTSIAVLEGTRLQPRAPGETDLRVTVGDHAKTIRVIVHTVVSSFAALTDDQKHVAIPLRLARGDTETFTLPRGVYWLKYLPRVLGKAPPSITLSGGANCGAGDGLRGHHVVADVIAIYCVVPRDGALVTIAHGTYGLSIVQGSLALDQLNESVTP